MNRLSTLVCALVLILVCGCPWDDDGDSDGNNAPPKPLMGMLQFRIQHNLQDDSCLADNDCFYKIEDDDETAAWLARIAADSNLAVLH